jgi:hypothetical protein
MDKRQFLVAGSVGAIVPVRVGAACSPARSGAALLTVAGAVPRANRGPLDPVLDQLMVKHKRHVRQGVAVRCRCACALPVTDRADAEYDAKPHKLSGPLRCGDRQPALPRTRQ